MKLRGQVKPNNRSTAVVVDTTEKAMAALQRVSNNYLLCMNI